MNRIQCLSCGHQALAFDNFMDLSVEFPKKAVRITGNIDLSECLQKFIEVEKMIDCGYKCEGCKKPVNTRSDQCCQ
jgi:ubiquitin C-terminal hydrolase